MEPRWEWVARLRLLEGCSDADIYFNELLHRWMFRMRGADGIYREQAWGWFSNPLTGKRLVPDPVTGLYPFRDLDDAAMAEALENLTRTFIGNPFDGAGTTRREVERRMRFNAEHYRQKHRAAGEAFADMVHERQYRLRGVPVVPVLIDLKPKPQPGARIEVASVIGGKA